MTASRSRRASGPAGAALVLLLALPAAAQTPLDIVPLLPEPAVEEPAEAPEEAPPLEIREAAEPSPEAVGAIAEAEGGFPDTLWEGAPRPLVEALMPRLPTVTTRTALRALVRRLLASAAAPPEGPAGDSLLALRAERLAAMGDAVALNALLRAAPAELADRRLWRVRLDSLLLAADSVNACAFAKDLVARDDDPYWEKTLIFCQALKGRHEQAMLGVSLLRERGVAVDDGFVSLLAAMRQGAAADLSGLMRPDALAVAMLRAARLPVPALAVETADPAAARAFALAAQVAPEVRVRAAERAESLGTLPTAALAEVYDGIAFPPEVLARPLSRAASDASPLVRALLHQAATAQTVPAARAEVIRVALGHAEQAAGFAGFATAARVYAQMIAELPVSAELTWFAGDAARALLAAGRPGPARAWLALADAQAAVDATAAQAAARLWPLAKLAIADFPWDEGRFDAWWQAVEGPGRDAGALRLVALLEALGVPVAAERVATLVAEAPFAWSRLLVAPLTLRLEGAAAEGRLGETVLLAALGLDDALGEPPPLALALTVRSLSQVGLETEARALALEAALAADAGG